MRPAMQTNVPGYNELRIHHLGLLTGQPDAAMRTLSAFGYALGETIGDPLQKADLTMATHWDGGLNVEIIYPHEDNPGLRALVKRKADYMYHVCYQTANADAALERTRSRGVEAALVSAAKPAALFGGDPVSFYLFEGIGLVEFLETKSGV